MLVLDATKSSKKGNIISVLPFKTIRYWPAYVLFCILIRFADDNNVPPSKIGRMHLNGFGVSGNDEIETKTVSRKSLTSQLFRYGISTVILLLRDEASVEVPKYRTRRLNSIRDYGLVLLCLFVGVRTISRLGTTIRLQFAWFARANMRTPTTETTDRRFVRRTDPLFV